jgi:hypothetical protein
LSNPSNDLDIPTETQANIHETLSQIIGITESPLDILTCSSEELRIALNDEQSFTSHIINEGEVLYGRLRTTLIPKNVRVF